MILKRIKTVEILGSIYTVEYDKTTNGGNFSCFNSTIKIGVKSIKNDPLYTHSVVSHEVMEVILTTMGVRFDNSRTGDNYLFNFDHQTFENAIQIHTQVMSKFY